MIEDTIKFAEWMHNSYESIAEAHINALEELKARINGEKNKNDIKNNKR